MWFSFLVDPLIRKVLSSKVFCNLQFAISTSKPPAPVALEGRLCLSGKPHEYKRSLVWLNLPPLAKLGIPRAGVATALNLQSPAVTGALRLSQLAAGVPDAMVSHTKGHADVSKVFSSEL